MAMANQSGGTAPAASGFDHGVLLNLESYQEWQVVDIAYDGQEKFRIPNTYSEFVGDLARKIDWMSLIGDEARHDNPALLRDKDKEKEKVSPHVKIEDRQVPTAGPWHVVAKHLHESLQQLNVLLDDLAILRSTDYMKPMRVADPLLELPDAHAVVQSSKCFQWVCKRKALMEAAKVFETAISTRRMVDDHDGTKRHKDMFFAELRKMRELWRVRKHGEGIVGDLGYKIFGVKTDTRGVFDITRRALDQLALPSSIQLPGTTKAIKGGDEPPSVLQVTVPGDLMRQTTLSVSIVRDNGSSTDIFPERDDAAFAYMEVDKKAAEALPWEKALKRAQETLICKDIFNNIFQDATQLQSRMAVIREGVILVTIFDDYLLKFELKHHPFTADNVSAEGDPFLTRFLREFHLAMECTRPIRPQMLVDLPLTHLPEALDYRGPLAFTQEDIEARSALPKGLLNRMTKVAGHYALVKRTFEVLKQHQIQFGDPSLRWRCVRSSPLHSLFLCELTNRNYDHVAGKLSFYVQVDYTSIVVVSKEGTEINCRRDESELRQALHLMNSTHEMHSIGAIAKQFFYQVLHANMNAMDEHGVPAPTLYLVNSTSTRVVYVVFPLAEMPQTFTRAFIADERLATDDDKKFTALNFARLPGRSICKKFDTLFSILKN